MDSEIQSLKVSAINIVLDTMALCLIQLDTTCIERKSDLLFLAISILMDSLYDLYDLNPVLNEVR